VTSLNVERIKLFSTRSPYWCLAAIAVAALGFATLFGLVENGQEASRTSSCVGSASA
jgi:ABC-2 type transport system permease protein